MLYLRYWKYQAWLRLAGATLLIGLLFANSSHADDGSAFEQYQHRNDSSTNRGFNPSIGQPGYDSYQRQDNQRIQDQNKQTLEGYGRQPAPSPYRGSQTSPIYTPNGGMILCQEGFGGAQHCR